MFSGVPAGSAKRTSRPLPASRSRHWSPLFVLATYVSQCSPAGGLGRRGKREEQQRQEATQGGSS